MPNRLLSLATVVVTQRAPAGGTETWEIDLPVPDCNRLVSLCGEVSIVIAARVKPLDMAKHLAHLRAV